MMLNVDENSDSRGADSATEIVVLFALWHLYECCYCRRERRPSQRLAWTSPCKTCVDRRLSWIWEVSHKVQRRARCGVSFTVEESEGVISQAFSISHICCLNKAQYGQLGPMMPAKGQSQAFVYITSPLGRI